MKNLLLLLPLVLSQLYGQIQSFPGSQVRTPHTNGGAYWNGAALTTSATGGAGTLCFVSANGGAPVWGSCAGSAATDLAAITAASAGNTIANGDNAQAWNFFLTTAGKVGFQFGETTAATSTGTPYLLRAVTLIGSTATPLNLTNSLSGSQTLPALAITPTWNTTGVATAIKLNVTNTASGAASKLMDLQVGGSSVASVDKTGAGIFLGHMTLEGVTSTGATGTGLLVFGTSASLITPDLGTPSAATLTNATGLPIATGVSGLAAGIATFLGTPTSANLAAAVTNETGTGALVFAGSPTFTGTITGAALTLTGTLTSNLTGSGTKCVHADNAGVFSLAAADCGSGGGSGTVTSASFTGGLISVATATTTPAFTVAGNSGGIPYFSGASTWASSAALTAHGVMIGGGAGTSPTSTGAGTSGQVLTSNGASADPTYQTVTGTGTVTVVGAGALTSTALVTGGGTTTVQTPSATATLDSSGNLSTPGSLSAGAGGSAAGYLQLGQGTAPSLGTTAVQFAAPASVTSYQFILPGASATGFLLGTDATNVNTLTFVGFSGTGNVARVTAPTLTNPVVGTQTQGDNSTKGASTAYTDLAVSNAIAAVNPAVAVQAATTTVLPNSPTYNNGVSGVGAFLTTATTNTALVSDGYTLTLGDRLLVKNQASTFQNGVYFISTIQSLGVAWILTRALDYDQPSDMNNTGAIPVLNGTVNGLTQWVQSSKVTTVGTDAVTFAEFTPPFGSIVTAASPGAGVGHFAGSTQALTSSLIVAADITSGTITATQLAAADLTTGTTKTFSLNSGYFECTGTCTITMPVPAAGRQYCVRNANNVATVITFAAIGSSAMYENTASTAYGTAGTGTLVSGGAVGDKMCLVGKDSTHYDVFSFNGSWTVN